jgi:hypothetical protein
MLCWDFSYNPVDKLYQGYFDLKQETQTSLFSNLSILTRSAEQKYFPKEKEGIIHDQGKSTLIK